MKIISPVDYKMFIHAPENTQSISKLKELVLSKKACVDCLAGEASGYHSVLLNATRSHGSVVQCQDCWDTYCQWVQKEVTNEEVAGIFATRQVKRIEEFQVNEKSSVPH